MQRHVGDSELPAEARDPIDNTRILIDAARAGDETAWSELDVRYRRALALFARSRRPTAFKARVGTEDVVQSTLLSAFRGLDGYEDRGSGSFLSWLKTILRNCVAERIRKHGAERRDAGREEPLGETSARAPAQDPSPSTVAATAESCSDLLRGISCLPSEHRDVIVMHFFEGLTTRRVAERLGTSETSVRRRLGRSLALLRKELERSRASRPDRTDPA